MEGGYTLMSIDWYTFNVFTLSVDIIVTFFSFASLVIVIEEKRALRKKIKEIERYSRHEQR